VLATDPRVLLFDEPLSALDKNLRDSLKYSILDLQRRTRKTAIYVTHDQSEAFAISDRIVVMNEGRVEQIGTQTDIYLHPRTPFVAEFIGANNSLRGTVTEVRTDGGGGQTVAASGITLRYPGTSRSPLATQSSYIRPRGRGGARRGELPGRQRGRGSSSR
jgi:ABC-type Fe3+/spermidine/putrescine transport system ATPase subunit